MENNTAQKKTKFILLEKFTEKGIQNIKDTTERYDKFKADAEAVGVTVLFVYWTVGQVDVIMGLEGYDDAVTSVILKLNAAGNIRTEVLRGFSKEEMKQIVMK